MTTDAAKSPKAQALEMISSMPDEVSTETILAELQFTLLIERRRESARRGNVVSHDEAKRRLGRWLNSSGK
jgi:hypothetical protein